MGTFSRHLSFAMYHEIRKYAENDRNMCRALDHVACILDMCRDCVASNMDINKITALQSGKRISEPQLCVQQ